MTEPFPYSIPPTTRRRRWPTVLAVCAAFLLGSGAGAGATFAFTGEDEPTAAADESGNTLFEHAREGCGSPLGVELLDDGYGLDLQSVGDGTAGASFEQVYCVLDALGTPESTKRRIGNTRALDGTQTATWNEISASWTYHPDDGLNMVLDLADSDRP